MRHVITFIAPVGTLLPHAELVTAVGCHDQAVWLEPQRALDLYLTQPPSDLLRSMLQQTCSKFGIDMVIQPAENREKLLLISDMDSTMIEQECIDELADCVGLKPHVSGITERAMRGELDFAQALRERVALLKGLSVQAMQDVLQSRITLMPGARTLVKTMRQRGAYCLLVSGGFTFFTAQVAKAIGFDADEANTLLVADGKLTGEVAEPILDKEAKRRALMRTAATHRIPLERSMAVGDGANDLPMLQGAGLGVAYHAKPLVVAAAAAAIHHNDLSALLFVQGIPRSDWVVA